MPATAPATVDPISLVRRALVASTTELATALDAVGPSDRRRQKALDRWFGGLAAQIRSHHELLDTLVVPTLTARGALADSDLDTLAADHSWIDEVLSDLGDALGVLSFGLGNESWWLGKASDLAAALRHVLAGQLAREERLLTPLVARWFSADEQEVVRREAMRAVTSGPVRFSLAWLFAHITHDEQAAVAPYAPATSRIVWRTQRGAYERSTVAAIG